MSLAFEGFRMPRYREIPNVGLYLEQTVKYINECLNPLGVAVTPSMLSNYVKQGYIRRPEKKQYYADQIAYLIFVALAKQVLSMENIAAMFALQEKTTPLNVTYDYFCEELEKMLAQIFTGRGEPGLIDGTEPFEKKTLYSILVAITNVIYLRECFKKLAQDSED